MSIISYAQNFEDVMLWRALGHIERGFYIDVGAQHPIIDSVSKAFYDHGWRGIHVEPTPTYADLLRQHRPDESVIQAAVSNRNGMVELYEIPGGGLSTGVESIAHDYEQQGIPIREILVPSITLDDIFDKAEKREIHWLKIDVEGMERQVLAGWEHHCTLPWIVVMESTIPCSPQENWEQWEPLLLKKGYRFVYFDGLNRFYLSPEHEDIAHAFHAPPNVFDGFMIEGSASSSFCQYLNGRHKEKEAELQQKIEIFHLELQSSQKQAEQISQETAARMRELHDQLEADRAEIQRLKAEWIEKEKKSMSLWQQSQDELQRKAQADLRELIEREHALSQKLQAGQQELLRLEQYRAQREKEHAEQISRVRQELESLLRTQSQREQEVAAQLLASQQEAFKISQMLAARERELGTQLKASQQQAAQEKTEQAHALQRERIEREQVAAERLEALRREMTEQADREAKTHAAQEQTLREQFEEARARIERLHSKWAEHEKELIAMTGQARDEAHRQAEVNLRELIDLERKHGAELNAQHEVQYSLQAHLTEASRDLHSAHAIEIQLRTEIAQTAKHAAGIAKEIARIKNSTSWKLTTPMRWLENVVWGQDTPSTAAIFDVQLPSGNSGITPMPLVPQHENTSPIQQSRMHIMNTIEHTDQLLELQGSEFIRATYRTLLGRDPDQKGALYYLGRLRAGYGKGSVISQIAKSKETKFRNVNVAGLDKLIRDEKLSKLWLWGWFKRTSRLEFQINRLDLVLASLEKRLESRIDSVEKKLDEINIRLMERTYPIIDNHQSTRDSRTTLPVDDTPRSSIVQGFKIPVECGASALIAVIEKQVTLSSEAATFATSNTDQ